MKFICLSATYQIPDPNRGTLSLSISHLIQGHLEISPEGGRKQTVPVPWLSDPGYALALAETTAREMLGVPGTPNQVMQLMDIYKSFAS